MPPGDRTGAAWYELNAEDSKLQAALDRAERDIKRALGLADKPVQLKGDERDVVRAAQHAEAEVKDVAAAARPVKFTGDAGPLERTLSGLREKVRGLSSESGGLRGSVLLGAGIGAGVAAWNALSNAIGGVSNFIVGAVKAGREEIAAIATLTQSIKANDAAWDGNIAAVEKVIDARQRLGFADDEQRLSLQRLVGQTKDLDKALELNRVAMDLARLRHIDLTAASDLVGKVYGGNIGILARYGIQLEKGTTATEALVKIQQMAAGQAEAFANTEEGAAESSRIALDNLTEDIGRLLLPMVTRLAIFVRDQVVPALSKFVEGLEDLGRVAGPVLGPALGLLLPVLESLAILFGARLVLGIAGSVRGMLNLVGPTRAATAALEGEAAAATAATTASSRLGGLFAKGLGAVALAPIFDNLLTSIEGVLLSMQYGDKSGKQLERVLASVGGSTYDAAEAMHRLDDANEKQGTTLPALTREFLELVEAGVDWREALDRVTDGTDRGGRAWEEYQDAVSRGAEGAAAAMKRAKDGVFDAREEIEHLRDATPEAAGAFDAVFDAIDSGYAKIRKVPGGFAAEIYGGGTIFSDSMASLAAAIPDAVQRAKDAGEDIAEDIPADLGAAILGSIGELEQVADRITEILEGSVSDAVAAATAAAQLLNPGVALALGSNSSEAKRAMLEDVVNPLLASMNALTDGAVAEGSALPPAMQRAIDARKGDVVDALRDLVGDSDATLGELKTLAEQQGWDGIVALIEGMEAQRHNANVKAGEVKADTLAGLQGNQEFSDVGERSASSYTGGVDSPGSRRQARNAGDSLLGSARSGADGSLYWTGYGVGKSYGDGLAAPDVQGYVNDKARVLRRGVQRILEFATSPAYTGSRKIGRRVGETYGEGFEQAGDGVVRRIADVRDRVADVMQRTFAPALSVAVPPPIQATALAVAAAAPVPAATPAAQGGAVTYVTENNFHVYTEGPTSVETDGDLERLMDRVLFVGSRAPAGA